MPKRIALVLVCSGLAACATGKGSSHSPSPAQKPVEAARAEADPGAPGMIPGECEALLNQSQAWGYVPGQKWKPDAPERALEVARFFAAFRLVPQTSSDFFRQLQHQGANGSVDEARRTLEQLSKAQVCDPWVAQTFLNGLLEYRWPRETKLEASGLFLRFFLNQQALNLPLFQRLMAARTYVKAAQRGLVPGSAAKAREFEAWLEKEVARAPKATEEVATPEQLVAFRHELFFSGEIRERLSRLLPLP